MYHCYLWESPLGLKEEGRAGLHHPGPGSRLAMEAGAPQGCSAWAGPAPPGVCSGRAGAAAESEHPSLATTPSQPFQRQHQRTVLPKLGWHNNEGHTHTDADIIGRLCQEQIPAGGRTHGQTARTLAVQHPASVRHPRGGLGPAALGGPRRGADPVSPTPSPRAPGPDASPRHLHLGPPPKGNLGRRPSLPAWGRGGGAGRGHGGARPAAGRVRGDKAHRLASARPRRPPCPAPARLRGRPGPTIMAARGALRPPEPRPGGAAACGAGRGGAAAAASGASREGAAVRGGREWNGREGAGRRFGGGCGRGRGAGPAAARAVVACVAAARCYRALLGLAGAGTRLLRALDVPRPGSGCVRWNAAAAARRPPEVRAAPSPAAPGAGRGLRAALRRSPAFVRDTGCAHLCKVRICAMTAREIKRLVIWLWSLGSYVI